MTPVHSPTSSHSRTAAHSTVAKKTSASRTRTPPKQMAPTADRIMEIQTALEKSGSYEGEPTGKWDDSTVEALKKFQQMNGLAPTGKLTAPSLQKLGLGSDIAGRAAPRPVTRSTAANPSTPY